MAFLDNSGDIILDAVLTDMGRKRLAAGRFNISKFALGDEEINYRLWNNTDARGTAFYDLEIMQTPVLEAFTSDQSLMKSRLLSFPRTDLLYLPILKLNNLEINSHSRPYGTVSNGAVQNPIFVVVADEKTHRLNSDNPPGNVAPGIIYGLAGSTHQNDTKYMAIDQGIVNPSQEVFSIVSEFDPPELLETAFIVKADNRLLSISTVGGGNEGSDAGDPRSRVPQYIDDDYVASYYFTMGQVNGAIKDGLGADFRLRAPLTVNDQNEANRNDAQAREVFTGPLGRTLRITPTVKPELQLSPGLFKELGRERGQFDDFRGAGNHLPNHYSIDTTITVQGMTTGFSIDIPIRIIKGIF